MYQAIAFTSFIAIFLVFYISSLSTGRKS